MFGTVKADREKMSWRLTAYGVANAVAGEALSSIVEADGVTAAASLPDERYDLVSLLEREVGGKRYLAVAQGRVFNPTAAAVAAAPLNGHKTQHRDLHEAPGGPPGAVRRCLHCSCELLRTLRLGRRGTRAEHALGRPPAKD